MFYGYIPFIAREFKHSGRQGYIVLFTQTLNFTRTYNWIGNTFEHQQVTNEQREALINKQAKCVSSTHELFVAQSNTSHGNLKDFPSQKKPLLRNSCLVLKYKMTAIQYKLRKRNVKHLIEKKISIFICCWS